MSATETNPNFDQVSGNADPPIPPSPPPIDRGLLIVASTVVLGAIMSGAGP